MYRSYLFRKVGTRGLPEITFRTIDEIQTNYHWPDRRADSNEKITKEATSYLDSDLSFIRNSTLLLKQLTFA